MKKITASFLLCVLVLTMLCSCGSKYKTTDVETVKNILVSEGIYDEDMANIKEVAGSEKLGALLSNSWSFTFCDFKKDTVACDTEYELAVLMCDEVTRMEDGNYATVEYEDEDIYKLIIRVDNTLMIITGPNRSKEDIRTLAEKIGYYE